MNRTVAKIIGGFVLLLGIGGLIMGEKNLGGAMNIDMALDITRIVLGAFLLYAATKSEGFVKSALVIFGIIYIANFFIALISPTMFGMLPDGYGSIDNILHLIGGIIALLAVGMLPSTSTRTAHHA